MFDQLIAVGQLLVSGLQSLPLQSNKKRVVGEKLSTLHNDLTLLNENGNTIFDIFEELIMNIFNRLFRRKQHPHIATYDDVRVWIFAQPLNAAAEERWGKMDVIPPKTLIQSADAQMELGGMLVTAVGEMYTVDKLPRMTKEQRAARIQKEAGNYAWMCSALETELIRYNVVLMMTKP